MRKKFILFFVGIFLVFLMSFIFAASSAPTGVITTNNVTANYDEGTFIVNWTNASVDCNYTIYIWGNDVLFNTSAENTTSLSFSYSNTTQANYTFTIQANNGTVCEGVGCANSSNVSIYVDSTAPVLNFTGYTNATAKKNTHTLTLNVSVGDALSGITGSWCTFNINGTNETVQVSSGWCNNTMLNLTSLDDGNQTINVYVNDTVNNVGVNLSFFVVMVDTTAPTNVFTCTPNVWKDQTVSCSCTSSDATSGVASTTFTENPSTATIGTITTRCISLDNAGNWVNSTFSYDVLWRAAGVQGSASSSPSWTNTYVVSEEKFTEGYTKSLAVDSRIRFQVNNINHHVGIKAATADSATVEIASDPIQVILNVGEEAKVDVTGDGFYDVYIILNSISGGLADITIKSIYEEVTEEGTVSTTGEVQNQTEEETSGTETPTKEMKLWWIWIIVGVVVLALAYLIFVRKKK